MKFNMEGLVVTEETPKRDQVEKVQHAACVSIAPVTRITTLEDSFDSVSRTVPTIEIIQLLDDVLCNCSGTRHDFASSNLSI